MSFLSPSAWLSASLLWLPRLLLATVLVTVLIVVVNILCRLGRRN
jgi:hypothetical protein